MTVREVAVLASGVGHVIEHKRCGIIAVSAGGQRRKPRHVVCSLPNNLDVAHDRVLSLQVFLKRPNVFERLKVGGRARNSLDDVALNNLSRRLGCLTSCRGYAAPRAPAKHRTETYRWARQSSSIRSASRRPSMRPCVRWLFCVLRNS
jgi:hypothetical protein